MSKLGTQIGFTLIEIAVVILLIGITLLFAIPRLPDSPLTDPTKKTSRWIILKVQGLKEQAIREQKQFALHVGIDTNRLWVTDESMSEEEKQNAQKNGYQLPGDINIMDVLYPDASIASSGQVDLLFYKKGYSDQAMLHLDDGKTKFSLQIEPFLSNVKYYDGYVGY
jgi:general secretion pathway protein H